MSVTERYLTHADFPWTPTLLFRVILSSVFAVLLTLVFLTQVTHPPAFVTGWRVAILFVLFGLFAMTLDSLLGERREAWYPYGLVLGASILLIVSLFRYQNGFGADGPNVFLVALVFVALLIYLLAYPDPWAFSPAQWLFIGAFTVLIGLFYVHFFTTSPAPTWPIWASVVAGVSLLVIPRFLHERVFLWVLALLSAGTAIIAIFSFVHGEFSLYFADIEQWSQTIPLTGTEVEGWYAHTSIFNNVNVFGLVSFAGFGASFVLFHRSVRQRKIPALVVAFVLVLLNGIGLVLSSSGVAWLAGGLTLVVYTPYALFGREAIIPTFVIAAIGSLFTLWVAYTGRVHVDDSNRFDHWVAGVRAIREAPTLLGHGHISTADFTAPFLEEASPNEPHNSYLDIVIRTGLVGLIVYLILWIGGLTHALVRYKRVNVGMLALAAGWALHHLFESYTIVQWTIPAVLSALTLGYLLFGDWVTPDLR